MDGAKFAKMLSDKHLFELDRMEYKYSVSIEAGHFLLFLVFLRRGFTLLFPRILPVLPL